MRKLPIALLASLSVVMVTACAAQVAQLTESDKGAPTVAGGAPAARSFQAPAVAKDTAPGAAESQPGSLSDRMIIRTTGLNLNVRNVSDSLDTIQDLVGRRGGYVANTKFKNEGERSSAVVSVRVPTERVDSFLRDVRGLAVKVNEESTSSQDVTEEYTDLGSQLRNQEATEAQYLELMKRAQSVDEIIKVQNQLTQIRGQIERTKGRIQFLERKADMAQIDITLNPEVAIARGAWDPGEVIHRAWESSLVALQRVAEVGITVVVFLWWLIPLGAIGWGAARVVRQRRASSTA